MSLFDFIRSFSQPKPKEITPSITMDVSNNELIALYKNEILLCHQKNKIGHYTLRHNNLPYSCVPVVKFDSNEKDISHYRMNNPYTHILDSIVSDKKEISPYRMNNPYTHILDSIVKFDSDEKDISPYIADE